MRNRVDNPPVVFLLMFAMAGISGYVSWAFSSVRKARNFVRTSWNDVETANGQRAEVVTQVIARIGHNLPAEHLDNLRRAHERIATAVGPRGSDHADGQLRLALAAIWDTQRVSADFTECRAKADAANRVVDDVARVYNGHVTNYEKLRKTESRKMVCELVGFDKESYFARATAGSPADSISEIASRAPQGITPPAPSIAGFESLPDPMSDPLLGLLPAGKVDRTTLGHSLPAAVPIATPNTTKTPATLWTPPSPPQWATPAPLSGPALAGPSIAAQLLAAQLSAVQEDQARLSATANDRASLNLGGPSEPTGPAESPQPQEPAEFAELPESPQPVEFAELPESPQPFEFAEPAESDAFATTEAKTNVGEEPLWVESEPEIAARTFEAWTPPVLGAPISRPVDPFRYREGDDDESDAAENDEAMSEVSTNDAMF